MPKEGLMLKVKPSKGPTSRAKGGLMLKPGLPKVVTPQAKEGLMLKPKPPKRGKSRGTSPSTS